MGFLADKTVFSPLTKEILEESISFSCGNEDLDGFFHNDAVAYSENLFGKSYCYYLEESKADVVGFDFMFSTEEQEKSYRGIVSDKPLKTRLMYFDLILIK